MYVCILGISVGCIGPHSKHLLRCSECLWAFSVCDFYLLSTSWFYSNLFIFRVLYIKIMYSAVKNKLALCCTKCTLLASGLFMEYQQFSCLCTGLQQNCCLHFSSLFTSISLRFLEVGVGFTDLLLHTLDVFRVVFSYFLFFHEVEYSSIVKQVQDILNMLF